MCRYCEYKPEKLKLYENQKFYSYLSDKQVEQLGFKRVDGKLFKIDNPNPSINLELNENCDFPCSMNIDIHINKNGKFYFNGGYHSYDEHDRYYNSFDDDLCDGSFSPDFKDRATGFKFCPMCGRKLVKNKK